MTRTHRFKASQKRLTDCTLTDQSQSFRLGRPVSVVVNDRQLDARLPYCPNDTICVSQRSRQRFLYNDVYAGQSGINCRLFVEKMRQSNIHDVEPFIGEHLPIISVDPIGCELSHPAGDQSARYAGVGYSNDLDEISQLGERGQMGYFCNLAKTDDTESQRSSQCEVLLPVSDCGTESVLPERLLGRSPSGGSSPGRLFQDYLL